MAYIPNPTTDKSSYAIGENVVINTNRPYPTLTYEVVAFVRWGAMGNGDTYDIATGVTTGTTWNMSAVATAIYDSIPTYNSVLCDIHIYAYANGVQVGDSKVTITLNVTNASPTFGAYTQIDTKSLTITLTGNNQTFVKGQSNGQITLTPATAIKGAMLTGYEISWGTKFATVSAGTTVINFMNVDDTTINVTAVDSRGNTKTVTHTVTLKDYFVPAIQTGAVVRTGNVDKETKLSLTATFFNATFGSLTNTSTLEYHFKQTSAGSYGSWTSLTHTPSGNTITLTPLALAGDIAGGFDINKSFYIQVRLTDRITSHTVTYTLSKGIPLIHYTKNGVGFGKVWERGIMDIVGEIYVDGILLGSGADTTDIVFTQNSVDYTAKLRRTGNDVKLFIPKYVPTAAGIPVLLFSIATNRPATDQQFFCAGMASMALRPCMITVYSANGNVVITTMNASSFTTSDTIFTQNLEWSV